ncbi:MAG: TRAP transporter small permease [Rhodobacter sp.]|uniref:TRAP transporter small permease n=1 Tax=Pararhodobacter sp. TaxID=2127056 RepID=UPI002BF060C7|nr:TRAP transporter small permease [Pararhodobacter sp.]MCC0072684.1 TRAP transporter small permease [Rhodobacter sp.]HPD92442.1 TRAP transporter small permease [Pararhodobacter sp.]
MERQINRLLGWVTRAEIAVIVLSFVAMTALLLADIVGREIVRQGLFGASSYALYFLILSAMLSFDVAVAKGVHLRPTAFDGLVPQAWAPTMERLGHVLSAAIAVLVVWGAWVFIAETRFFHETNATIRLPLWPMQTPLVIGFGLSGLRHCLYALYPGLAPQKPAAEAEA